MNKRTIVIGDIHGCLDTVQAFLKFNVKPQPGDTLIFLGDYVDRGPKSAETLHWVLEMVSHHDGLNVIPLKGNHEDLFLKFIEDPMDNDRRNVFIFNGGDRTLESYDRMSEYFECELLLDMVDITYRMDQTPGELAPKRTVRIPQCHIDFLRSLKLRHEDDHFHYVHAGMRPLVDPADQIEDDLLWIRQEFMYSQGLFGGKRVIHGHTPARHIESRDNRINVDLGLGKNGNIGGLAIDQNGLTTHFERAHEPNDVYDIAYAYQPEGRGGGWW